MALWVENAYPLQINVPHKVVEIEVEEVRQQDGLNLFAWHFVFECTAKSDTLYNFEDEMPLMYQTKGQWVLVLPDEECGWAVVEYEPGYFDEDGDANKPLDDSSEYPDQPPDSP